MAQIVKAKPGIMIVLGKEGEHQARSVEFDLSEWRAVYGPGDVQLLVRRSGEELPYPVEITQEENRVVWTVNATELARPGMGYCKLRYYQGETVVKSEVWLTFVMNGAGDTFIPPDSPGESWLDRLFESTTKVTQEAEEAKKIAQTALQEGKNKVDFSEVQFLNRAQKMQVRQNIGLLQPDWNQSDCEAADYVKNRPFYDDYSTVLVEEYVDTDYEEDTAAAAYLRTSWRPEPGVSYRVMLDGKPYDCVADSEGTLLRVEVPEGVITLAYNTTVEKLFLSTPVAGSYGVSIAAKEIVKLDNAYLDEEYIMRLTGGRADWNASEGEAGYIGNRPFYAGSEKVVAEEQTVTTEDHVDGIAATLMLTGDLEVGKTYIVEFDGTSYRCTAYHPVETWGEDDIQNVSPDILLGDIRRTGDWYMGHDGLENGEPFAIIYSGSSWLMTDSVRTHTVQITETGGIVIETDYQKAIKGIFPTVELTATFADGTTKIFRLYGEAVTE